MGKRALAMEGTLATIMDMLCCTNIPTTICIITSMSGEQATVTELKEELENEKKFSSKLTGELYKSKYSRKNQLRINVEQRVDVTNREKAM